MRRLNNALCATLKIVMAFVCLASFTTKNAHAANAMFQVSPMHQIISLTPGETYYGTFKVTNPEQSDADFYYQLSVLPFHVDDSYEVIFENNGDYNQIVDWLQLEWNEGTIPPNETHQIRFKINVPEDAPAGGQYAAIKVSSKLGTADDGGVSIQNRYEIAHIIYAEVAGETKRQGDITDVSVPSFLFSGNITGSARIKNTGNVHSNVASTLQVFPLFSKEEVFTNEEDPKIGTILPETERTTVLTWEETPSIGIFHVIYNVEYEGVESKVDKMVIVCPLWLLFLIILALFLLIFKIFWGKKKAKD